MSECDFESIDRIITGESSVHVIKCWMCDTLLEIRDAYLPCKYEPKELDGHHLKCFRCGHEDYDCCFVIGGSEE